eukprot:Hpha_TRINITY_DN12318_c0_g1::TRINITY_DN12318_c0_g1_i3::g.155963::m.155963
MRVFPCPSLVLRTLNPNLSVMAPTLDSMRSLAGAMRTVSRSLRDVPSSPLHGLKPSDIPRRVIWGYWAQGEAEMPALQRLCVETWRRRNPGWDVRVLCRRTVWDYLGESDLPNRWREVRSHQLASDAVRLALPHGVEARAWGAACPLRGCLHGRCHHSPEQPGGAGVE